MPSSKKLEKNFKHNVKEYYRKIMKYEKYILFFLILVLCFLYLRDTNTEKITLLIISLFSIYLVWEKDSQEREKKIIERIKKNKI